MSALKIGDTVTRVLCGLRIKLKITAIDETTITCGAWKFDKATGAEIDEELGWGPPPLTIGSYITLLD